MISSSNGKVGSRVCWINPATRVNSESGTCENMEDRREGIISQNGSSPGRRGEEDTARPMQEVEAVAANWAKSFSWLDTAVGGGGVGVGDGGAVGVLTGSGALANPAPAGLFDLAFFNFFFLDLLFEAVPAPNPLPANDVDVTVDVR